MRHEERRRSRYSRSLHPDCLRARATNRWRPTIRTLAVLLTVSLAACAGEGESGADGDVAADALPADVGESEAGGDTLPRDSEGSEGADDAAPLVDSDSTIDSTDIAEEDAASEDVADGRDRQDTPPTPREDAAVADARHVDGELPSLDADVGSDDPWRSALYPEDWSPGFEHDGMQLPDFSYAGYRNSEMEPGSATPDRTIDAVAEHGADPTGEDDATAAIQATVDDAAGRGGGVVLLPEGLYRVDGIVHVRSSNVVIRGAGRDATKLWLTTPVAFEGGSRIIFGIPRPLDPIEDGILGAAADIARGERRILVDDASAFSVGDPIQVGWRITPRFVEQHGMSGTWTYFLRRWTPFFLRTVVAVDREATPQAITVDVPFRYPGLLADGLGVRAPNPVMISEVGIESLSVGSATDWDVAWESDRHHAITFANLRDGWIHDIGTFAPPGGATNRNGAFAHLASGGIYILDAMRVTVSDSTMALPQNRGGGGSGYLFEVGTSSEVLFRDCVARGGRHNYIQNWGFGASGIVWLRVTSFEGFAVPFPPFPSVGTVGLSEFHHSLAMSSLIDSSRLDDGWAAVNRGDFSSGAGHTATNSAFWNISGTGEIHSFQFGHGFVVGTRGPLLLKTRLPSSEGAGTAPEDWVEGVDRGAGLEPASLFESQLSARLRRGGALWPR